MTLPLVDSDATSSVAGSSPSVPWSPSKTSRAANGAWQAPARRSLVRALPDLPVVEIAQVLQWHAAYLLDSGKHGSAGGKRRRLTGKQPMTNHEILEFLANDPEKPLRSLPTTWQERRHSYLYVCQLAAHHHKVQVRLARQHMKEAWTRAPIEVKINATCLRELVEAPVAIDAKSVATTARTDVDCYGILLTWHTRWGRGADFVFEVLQNCRDREEQCDILRTHGPLEESFQSFDKWIAATSVQMGFAYYAACMELCEPDAPSGRVHLHAYLCLNWRHWRGGDWHPLTVALPGLKWNEFTPHAQVAEAKSRGNPRRILQEGLYYCIAPKIGSLFRGANFALFKVPRRGKSSVWQIRAHVGS